MCGADAADWSDEMKFFKRLKMYKAMPRDLSLDGLQLESDITELIRKATGGAEHRCIECGVRMPDTENKTCDVCHEGGAE